MKVSAVLLLLVAVVFSSCATEPKVAVKSKAPSISQPVVTQAVAVPIKEVKPEIDILKTPSKATEKAPEVFKVKFATTKGDFTIEVNRTWAPLGADRFYNLVKAGFFSDAAFFRVISGFMVQFGIHGNPEVAAVWRDARITDDPAVQSNKKGYISYAMAGPNTRTSQLFINFGDNSNLDGMGFSPFGKVIEGMDIVDSIYAGYGEGAPMGQGPDQGRIQMQGNAYLKSDFPKLDYIKSATIIP